MIYKCILFYDFFYRMFFFFLQHLAIHMFYAPVDLQYILCFLYLVAQED